MSRRFPFRIGRSPAVVVSLVVLVAVAVVAGCGRGADRGRSVTLKGSDTMVILGQKWAEIYMETHQGTVVQVTGGGSGTGIAALINGTTQIAQSSRPMKEPEKAQIQEKTGAPVVETAVAKDGLTVFVHTSNPVNQITIEQLKAIFTGAVTNWKDLGGPARAIVLYSRENSSGTYEYFKEHVLGGADFAPAAQTLPGTAAVVNAVQRDANGIGYGGIAYGSGIKQVAVVGSSGTAVQPSEGAIRDGSYPLARDLYWYMTSSAPAEAKALQDWVLSADGQKVVTEVGYFPVR
jgi:phosphate transport system substrate-binding protein